MLNDRPKVSIIVPIYNAENYLEKCVKSVLAQSYGYIEIILVNDGSKDRSWEICKKIQAKDCRVKIYNKVNGGVSSARNLGIRNSTGKWIMFVDPDDYLDIQIVEKLVCRIDKKSDIICTSCVSFTNNDRRVVHFFECNRQFESEKQKESLYMQLMYPEFGQNVDFAVTAIGVPWGKLYNKNFLNRVNLKFDTRLRRMQDNIFNFYAFYYARKIYYLDEPLYYYRYEHMDNYFSSYKDNISSIFLPVIRERYEQLNKLEMFNGDLKKAYINQALRILTIIFKSQTFNKSNSQAIQKKKKEYYRIINNECFSSIVKFKNIRYLRNYKQKIIMYLLVSKQIYLLSLIIKIFS